MSKLLHCNFDPYRFCSFWTSVVLWKWYRHKTASQNCKLVVFAGIGGFIAKSRQVKGPPKLVIQGPHTADGHPPVLQSADGTSGTPAGEVESAPFLDPNEAASKKKRKQRIKGIIEDTYPVYLQVCNTLYPCTYWIRTYSQNTIFFRSCEKSV